MSTSDTVDEGTASLFEGSVWDRNLVHKGHNLRVLDSLVYSPIDRTIIEDHGTITSHLNTSLRHCMLTASVIRHIQEVVVSVSEEQAVQFEAAEKELEGLKSANDAIEAAEAVKKEVEGTLFEAKRKAEDAANSLKKKMVDQATTLHSEVEVRRKVVEDKEATEAEVRHLHEVEKSCTPG